VKESSPALVGWGRAAVVKAVKSAKRITAVRKRKRRELRLLFNHLMAGV
jgi:hypothetical protein